MKDIKNDLLNKNLITNRLTEPRLEIVKYDNYNSRLVFIKGCRKKGFEDNKKREFGEVNKEESLRTSISRSRKRIRELALSNDFNLFATFTINSDHDRYNIDECWSLIKKALKKIKRLDPYFQYLIICEKHKDGAFHFHGLLRTFNGPGFYLNQYNYLSNKVFDNLGYNSFSKIKSKERVANYILKYITKDCVRNNKGQTYIRSKNLKEPKKEIIDNYLDTQIEWSFENKFVCVKDFTKN